MSSANTPRQSPRTGNTQGKSKQQVGRVKSLPRVAHDDLKPGTNLDLDYNIESLQAVLSWKSRNTKMGCDLDITGITYDLKGRFLEIIGFDSPVSNDASIALSGDSDGLNGADEEVLSIDLSSISPKVRAVIVLATSLSSNFTEVSQLRSFVRKITYMKVRSALPAAVVFPPTNSPHPLCALLTLPPPHTLTPPRRTPWPRDRASQSSRPTRLLKTSSSSTWGCSRRR